MCWIWGVECTRILHWGPPGVATGLRSFRKGLRAAGSSALGVQNPWACLPGVGCLFICFPGQEVGLGS